LAAVSLRPRIALVAGEASGDQLGAALIHAVRALRPDVEFVGVAGPAMRAAGCEAWHGTEELSVMGLAEVLRHLPRLAGIRSSVLGRMLAHPPAAFVGIDSPDFNLRLASRLRAAGIPTAQYVCPSVWAWRQGRVRLLRRACDHVLCVLPFEVPFLQGSGVRATFVGHPFADQIPEAPDRHAARTRLGLSGEPVIGLLPGSRLAEVTRLGPPFLQAARRLRQDWPEVAFAAPMASPGLRRVFEAQLATHARDTDVRLVDGRAREVMAASDALIVASGTATLEAMLINRPMVVAYRVAPVSYRIVRSLNLVRVRHVSLPNLLAGETVVPEFLQGDVTPERLSAATAELLRSAGRRERISARFTELGRELRCGASQLAAGIVLEMAGLR
jgi:lipid-A-disaccharide synthase